MSKITSLNPTVYLSLSLQMPFNILQYFSAISSCKHRHHPPTDSVTFPGNSEQQRHPPSSLEGWKLISLRSTSHDPSPPAERCPHSYKPSSTSCNILLSWSNEKGGKKNTMSPLSPYFISPFFPVQHCIHTWSLQGHKDTKRKKNKRCWDKMVCPQKKKIIIITW